MTRFRIPKSLVFAAIILALPLTACEALTDGEVSAPRSPTPDPPSRAGQVRALVFEQEARGLPDQKPDQPIRQKMILDPAQSRLILEIYKAPDPGSQAPPSGAQTTPRTIDRRIILHMNADPPEIFEIWDGDRTFRRTNRDLNAVQEERDKFEATMLRHLPELSKAEQEAALRDNFLRRDGKRVVDLVRIPAEKPEKILGRACEHVKVIENERTVIDAWVTKEIPGGRSYFQLYRRLGAFSQEVLAKLAGEEGIPLKAEITVVTAAPAYKISAACLSAKEEEIPASSFEVPAGYKEKKEDLPPIVKCPVCGKDVERAEPGGIILDGSTIYYLCSPACREKQLKALDELERKRSKREE